MERENPQGLSESWRKLYLLAYLGKTHKQKQEKTTGSHDL